MSHLEARTSLSLLHDVLAIKRQNLTAGTLVCAPIFHIVVNVGTNLENGGASVVPSFSFDDQSHLRVLLSMSRKSTIRAMCSTDGGSEAEPWNFTENVLSVTSVCL